MSNSKFQLERIILFSDAVFAIAITLMIIEIKAPHLEHNLSFSAALSILSKKFPIFIGTILSFFLIGKFWFDHHDLMKHLTNYDNKFIKLNFSFLLAVALIPFSSSFVFENLQAFSSLPLLVYNLNMIIATLLSYKLYNYALNKSNHLCTEQLTKEIKNSNKESFFAIGIYLLVIIIALINPNIAPIFYSLFAMQDFVIKKI